MSTDDGTAGRGLPGGTGAGRDDGDRALGQTGQRPVVVDLDLHHGGATPQRGNLRRGRQRPFAHGTDQVDLELGGRGPAP